MARSSVNLNNNNDDERGGLEPLRKGKENNQSANERFKKACDNADLSKGQRQLLHKELGNNEQTYQEIYDAALVIKRDYPNT